MQQLKKCFIHTFIICQCIFFLIMQVHLYFMAPDIQKGYEKNEKLLLNMLFSFANRVTPMCHATKLLF